MNKEEINHIPTWIRKVLMKFFGDRNFGCLPLSVDERENKAARGTTEGNVGKK